MIPRRLCRGFLLAVVVLAGPLFAAGPQPMGDAEFARLHGMLKPQRGESRWMEIDWHASVWEARRKAADQGKPLFLMAGSGGAPAAGC